jgi:hypothetical protein
MIIGRRLPIAGLTVPFTLGPGMVLILLALLTRPFHTGCAGLLTPSSG